MRFVLTFALMMVSFFGTVRAEEKKVIVSDSIVVTGYALGALKSDKLESLGISLDPTATYVVIGMADGTPHKGCGADVLCSKTHNQSLALLRASEMTQLLKKRGVSHSQIRPDGIVYTQKGEDFRGVLVYVFSEEKVASNKTTPSTVAQVPTPKVASTPVPTVVQVTPTVVNTVNPLADSLAMLKQQMRSLQDSLAVLSQKVSVPTNKEKNDTIKAAKPNDTAVLKVESNPQAPIVNIDVGVGVVGMKANNGVDSFAPSLGVFMGPRSVPIELAFEIGYRPSKSSKVCNRADVFGAISVRVPVSSHIAISGGVFTDRESCRSGGPKVDERWINRTNGLSLGLVSGVDVSSRFRLNLKPEITYAWMTSAQTSLTVRGAGLRLGAEIRTNGRK